MPLLAATGVLVGGSATSIRAFAAPVTYSGTVVTDVSLNGHLFHRANVTITFQGRTEDVATFESSPGCLATSSCDPYVTWITKGRAKITIASGANKITAYIAPGQLFVSADTTNGGIGFGSTVASIQNPAPPYPLAYALGSATDWTTTFGPGDTSVLTTTINLSGIAFACLGYPFPDGVECSDPTPYPIATDHGPLLVFEPYGGGGAHHGSKHRGIFQVFVGSRD
jgi:hypothetical protein